MKSTARARLLRRIAVVACAVGAAASACAAGEPIRIMVGGVEKQIYLPAALAQSLGYFTDQGLDVKLRTDTSGVNAEDELLTGGAQGVVGFYDHTIALQAKGKYVQCVVQFSQSPGEAVVVSTRRETEIRSPADFKGRTLGVTGLGSSTDLLTRYLGAMGGLKNSEMRIVAAGSGANFANAMRVGKIDAGMTTEPTVSQLLHSGDAKLLVDLRSPASTEKAIGGLYPGACLYMSTLWVNTHKTQVQGLVNALVKALRFINSHSAGQIAAKVPSEYFLGDASIYIDALRDSKSMFLADGAMPPSGPPFVLKVMRATDHAVQNKPLDLSRTYTTEFTSRVR